MLDTVEWGCFDDRQFPRLKLIRTSMDCEMTAPLVIHPPRSCEDVMRGGVDETIIAHAKQVMFRFRDHQGLPDYTKLPDHVKLRVNLSRLVYVEEHKALIVSLHFSSCRLWLM